MKIKDEMNHGKQELGMRDRDFRELSEEELSQVSGGNILPITGKTLPSMMEDPKATVLPSRRIGLGSKRKRRMPGGTNASGEDFRFFDPDNQNVKL